MKSAFCSSFIALLNGVFKSTITFVRIGLAAWSDIHDWFSLQTHCQEATASDPD